MGEERRRSLVMLSRQQLGIMPNLGEIRSKGSGDKVNSFRVRPIYLTINVFVSASESRAVEFG